MATRRIAGDAAEKGLNEKRKNRNRNQVNPLGDMGCIFYRIINKKIGDHLKTVWKNKSKGKKEYQLKNLKVQIPHTGVLVRVQVFLSWNKKGELVDVVASESPEMAKARGWEKVKVAK